MSKVLYIIAKDRSLLKIPKNTASFSLRMNSQGFSIPQLVILFGNAVTNNTADFSLRLTNGVI